MNFECFANELLIDVFEYLDAAQLFDAFYGLNHRFNSLLGANLASYHLDFRSVSKSRFERVCCDHLPSIVTRIRSLHLSDDDRTPDLPRSFLSYDFSLDQFTHLRSLALYQIRSFRIFHQFFVPSSKLSSLTHLKLIECYFNYSHEEMCSLFNGIWSFTRLMHFTLDQTTSRKIPLASISTISSSIKSLVINKVTTDCDGLRHLLVHTPSLQRLTINLVYGFPEGDFLINGSSLRSLKLTFHGSIDILTNLLRHLPNLTSLRLQTGTLVCDGSQWEQILLRYLHRLTTFQLKMNLNFPQSTYVNDQVDRLLDTFRSVFWLQEHGWFVRCDWDPSNIFNEGILYTLPYVFDDCFYFDAVLSKSTCLDQADQWSYNHVHMLSNENPGNGLEKDSTFSLARFPHLTQLKISFAFEESFWSCLPSLSQLTSIHIAWLDTEFAYRQCQQFLQRACHLHSMTLDHTSYLSMEFFSISSPSIRQLDFIPESKSEIRFFDDVDCQILSQSSLIRQCEVLLIGIKYRMSILSLIDATPNLRALTCQCKDDEYTLWCAKPVNDELIEWFKKHLPTSHSISRDEKRQQLIRFWIQKQPFNHLQLIPDESLRQICAD